MSVKKLNLGILYGGQSSEHEISILSAQSVYQAIDRRKYNIFLIGIDRAGHWHLTKEINPKMVFPDQSTELALLPGELKRQFINLKTGRSIGQLDVIFPLLHGRLGEDGTVQGLLELMKIPYVGSGVLGSAIAMDKAMSKQILSASGLAVAKWIELNQPQTISYLEAKSKLGATIFVKPANAGSSVGVTKVNSARDLSEAIHKAYEHDSKILLEQAIIGRELEIAVLGNDQPIASLAGEIVLQSDFYTYEAKYLNEQAVQLKIPAELEPAVLLKIQQTAIKAYKILNCAGLARVDFFLTPTGDLLINEINTLPGFTNFSMYPKLWEVSGISYQILIDRLIELAVSRHSQLMKL